MYTLTDEQINFIQTDIHARGVLMDSLQHDLLDHVCCIIEQNLDGDGDFERFYEQTIKTFYASELSEIEAETINLLTHKNYYTMKKVMLASGAFSVAALSLGIVFKFMHWPSASACIVIGIVALSLVFLPLMFTLKAKEQQSKSDKIVAGIGTFSGILISLGILFKMMHWAGANVMCSVALAIMLFVFLPVYFFSGIRNPITKVNTIVSSVLLFAGCALILTLIRAPHGTQLEFAKNTDYFLRNEQMVQNEQRLLSVLKPDGTATQDANQINILCEDLKSFLLKKETGAEKIDADFESKGALIGDTYAEDYFADAPEQERKVAQLKAFISAYNDKNATASGFHKISLRNSIFDDPGRVKNALNDLIQIQMAVLQNQRKLLASK